MIKINDIEIVGKNISIDICLVFLYILLMPFFLIILYFFAGLTMICFSLNRFIKRNSRKEFTSQ